MELQTMVQRVKNPKSLLAFDRKALQTACQEPLAQLFADPPECDWGMRVDEHAMKITQWLSTKLHKAFPVCRSRPKKGYISEATWEIRKERLQVRSVIQTLRSSAILCTMDHVVRAWKACKSLNMQRICVDSLSNLFLILASRRKAAVLLRALGKGLRADRTAALERLGEQAKTLSQKDFADALKQWGVKSKKKPGCFSPLPLIRGKEGEVLDSNLQVAERWRQHFAEQEDGLPVSLAQLIAINEQVPRTQVFCPQWDQVPTLFEVERVMRGTAANKAFFYDGIPGDLLKLAASQCAELFYPLFLKQVVWQQEALIFKGGRLVPLFKKGDPSQCANFRSIFVSSPVGKILHGIYRQELGQLFVHAALPMQIGGLKGHTIAQASHALMLGQSIAIQENQSFAVLFIDIQNAFYRLMRKHLTDSKQDLRSIQELFDSLSLPKEAFDEFRLHFLEGPTLSEETVSPFLACSVSSTRPHGSQSPATQL